MFVPSFLALWWPKIDLKSGFPQLFAETVGSIHFIPGIYTYGVSLWTPIDFRVRALIFGPLVAKIDRKSGFPQLFAKTVGSIHFIPGIYTYGVSLWTPIDFRPQWLKNRTICWVFLDGVGTDQSGGILSPFMGTACWLCYLLCICLLIRIILPYYILLYVPTEIVVFGKLYFAQGHIIYEWPSRTW